MISAYNEINLDLIKQIQDEMQSILPQNTDNRLVSAMKYSCLNHGKMLRPILLIHTARLFDEYGKNVIKAACAIEIVHCYSLIHDDLPSMDDDDLRRGLLTCHLKYDEATAILAGDALLTYAFEILSDESVQADANIRCEIIKTLSQSIGYRGMAGGQMYDLLYENTIVSEEEIIRMLEMKTADLFVASVKIGALIANASNHHIIAIEDFALKFGLAYQIIDDILDVIGDEETLGKKTSKDIKLGKSSIVNYKGIEYATNMANNLLKEAAKIIDSIDLPYDKKKPFYLIIDSIQLQNAQKISD